MGQTPPTRNNRIQIDLQKKIIPINDEIVIKGKIQLKSVKGLLC